MPMTLGAALALRAGNEREIAQLTEWALSAARYQQGAEPAESSAELLRRATELIFRQAELIARINLTNATQRTASGASITGMLAQREALRRLHKAKTDVVNAAAGSGSARRSVLWRSSASELPEVAGVNVAAVRGEIRELAQRIREIDGEIQATDMTVDLAGP